MIRWSWLLLLVVTWYGYCKPVKEILPHTRDYYAGYIKAITDNFDQLFQNERKTRSLNEEDDDADDDESPSEDESNEAPAVVQFNGQQLLAAQPGLETLPEYPEVEPDETFNRNSVSRLNDTGSDYDNNVYNVDDGENYDDNLNESYRRNNVKKAPKRQFTGAYGGYAACNPMMPGYGVASMYRGECGGYGTGYNPPYGYGSYGSGYGNQYNYGTGNGGYGTSAGYGSYGLGTGYTGYSAGSGYGGYGYGAGYGGYGAGYGGYGAGYGGYGAGYGGYGAAYSGYGTSYGGYDAGYGGYGTGYGISGGAYNSGNPLSSYGMSGYGNDALSSAGLNTAKPSKQIYPDPSPSTTLQKPKTRELIIEDDEDDDDDKNKRASRRGVVDGHHLHRLLVMPGNCVGDHCTTNFRIGHHRLGNHVSWDLADCGPGGCGGLGFGHGFGYECGPFGCGLGLHNINSEAISCSGYNSQFYPCLTHLHGNVVAVGHPQAYHTRYPVLLHQTIQETAHHNIHTIGSIQGPGFSSDIYSNGDLVV